MQKLKVLDLFSGIGGFSLGLEATGGFETVAFCEIDPFCQKVLNKHWPTIPIFDDVRKLEYDGPVDVICGGFPCQDVSIAGNQAGLGATRSGLWEPMAERVCEFGPQYVIVENVTNLLAGPSEYPGRWFGRILADLASIGYDAEWHCIRGFRAGLPQSRDRVYVVAYPEGNHVEQVVQERALPGEFGRTRSYGCGFNPGREVYQPALASVDDGLPVTAQPYKQYGNAVMPPVIELLGQAILSTQGTE